MAETRASDETSTFRRYNRLLYGGVLLVLAVVAVTDVVVDPFRIHDHFRLSALEPYRSSSRPRIHNSVVATRGRFDVAILGSSRAMNSLRT
ncbi:MAG: hypothetical protein KDC38_15620, partial [Planctomycetes bacterium]|nr:hypothetical protein [Planctomycetota bacterium]